MELLTIIGIAASACTALSSLPQLIKIVKEKNAKNVSKVMLFVLLLGLGLWIVYGVMKTDWIIVVSNGLSFLITAFTLIASLKYKKQ